jgi:hypothetical protein
MAPVAATLNVSRIEGISDAARARELYKYYQPNPTPEDGRVSDLSSHLGTPGLKISDDPASLNELDVQSNISSSKKSSPDTTLTAFSQLVAWRLGSQRAMIRLVPLIKPGMRKMLTWIRSVIDAETQYFIAESTRTLDLADNNQHAPGDGLWIGCSTVSKAGRLCERYHPTPPQHLV